MFIGSNDFQPDYSQSQYQVMSYFIFFSAAATTFRRVVDTSQRDEPP